MTAPASADFNAAFCAIVRELRERRGLTQIQGAVALGITAESMRKYESRTPLPHRYIPAFCILVGISETELFSLVARRAANPKRRGKDAA